MFPNESNTEDLKPSDVVSGSFHPMSNLQSLHCHIVHWCHGSSSDVLGAYREFSFNHSHDSNRLENEDGRLEDFFRLCDCFLSIQQPELLKKQIPPAESWDTQAKVSSWSRTVEMTPGVQKRGRRAVRARSRLGLEIYGAQPPPQNTHHNHFSRCWQWRFILISVSGWKRFASGVLAVGILHQA